MKRIFGILLGCLLSFCLVNSASALTTHKPEDWVPNGELGSVDKVDDNTVILKGASNYGPYSKASTAKLEDGILEETYVDIDLDKMQVSNLFEVTLGLKNANNEYVTEAVTTTQKTSEDTATVIASWAPDFKVEVKESGIYTYQWHMYIKDGKSYVNFTLKNSKGVVGSTGDIDMDSFPTEDTKNPVAEEEDVSVKYLWFCNIQVADGIKVYSKLPGADNAEIVEPDADSNLGFANLDKVSDILKKSLEGLDLEGLTDDTAVAFDVKSTEVKAEEIETEEFTNALAESAKNGKIASYFDVSIAVKDAMTNKELGKLSELSEDIELVVMLPENIPEVAEGYQRVYYILREHEGKVTVLDANVTENGKGVSFTSNQFSTYALAYDDVQVPSQETPNTLDKAPAYLAVGAIALTGVVALGYSIKKRFED